MTTISKTALAWLLLLAAAYGQDLTVKARTYYRVPKVELTTVGDIVLADSLDPLSVAVREAKSVGVVRIDTEASKVEMTVSGEDRQPIQPLKITENIWLIEKPGKWWVDVTAIDFQKGIYGRKLLLVEVGGTPPGPGPGPGPDPNPDPSGPFDGLAARVKPLAVTLPPDHRNQIVGILENAATKMQRYEFKQVAQAQDYIRKNWPPCTSENCAKLWNVVLEDAKTRQLGWQEVQAYYREVARGVK